MSIMAPQRVLALPRRLRREGAMEEGYKPRHFNKSLFVFWIVSYVSILIIPILFSGITYYTTVDTLEKEIGETNAAMLGNIQQVIDGKVEKINELGTQFSLEPQIKALVSDTRYLSQEQRVNIYRLQRNYLKAYTMANAEIDDIYIYLPNQGYVFSTYNSFSVRGQGLLNITEALSPADWAFEVEAYHDAGYRLLPVYQNTDKATETLVYFTSLPWEFTLQNRLLMAVVLDRQSIMDILQDTRWLGHSTVTILGGDGSPLLSSGEKLPASFGALYAQLADGATTTLAIEGEEMVVTSVSSAVTDWKYVFTTPKALYHRKMQGVSHTFTLCIVVSILFGGVLSIIFIRKNYSPVKALVRVLAQNDKQPQRGHAEMDQYQFIQQSIIRNISARQSIQARLDSQEKQQMEVWLYEILSGRYRQSDRFEAFCTDNFLADSFGVLLVQPRQMNAGTVGEITRALEKVLEEQGGNEACAWFVVEMERRVVCLLNFNGPTGAPAFIGPDGVAHRLFSYLELERNIGARLAVSGTHHTVAGISGAYGEALEALEYLNMIDAEDRVIAGAEVQNMSSKHQYSLQTEQLLINSIKLGDGQQARLLAERILATSQSLSPRMLKLLMVDVTNTVVKMINEVYPQGDGGGMNKALDALMRSDNIQRYGQVLRGMLDKLCQAANSGRPTGKNQLIDAIMQDIRHNYADQNLNISALANKFGLTPAYLSRRFRDHTGETLMDFINRTRLEHVKRLLEQGDMSINQIVGQVGFTNSNTLIRIFKKYEGMTPGQYKELSFRAGRV